MTAIKHTLQREVFLPCDERLLAVLHVTKSGKKKKASFVCAAVTTEKPIQALICEVKKSERGDSYKKKLSWALRELRVLDAKYVNGKDTAEFEMTFDKLYKWTASSMTEKYAFIQCLWKLSQRYLVQKPEYTRIPHGILEDTVASSETDKSVQQVEDIALGQDSDWHALTQREERDLETLMAQCDFAISNAELFAEQLSKDLSVLDGANIHSIMGSEDQVLELMVLLDDGLHEAVAIEEKLDDYEQKLQSVKELMETMKDKDQLIHVRNHNHLQLLAQLDQLITQLDMDPRFMTALLNADLSNGRSVQQCTEAALCLLKCMQTEIHPALRKMSAVQEQEKKFTKLKSSFTKRIAHHLNNLFIHQGNELGENLSRYGSDVKLPNHSSSHRDLLPYAGLMNWLKVVEPDSYMKLRKVYTASLAKLYDREVREFIESSKQKLATVRPEKKGLVPGLSTPKVSGQSGSSSSLNRSIDHRTLKSPSLSTLDSDSRGSDPDMSGRLKFDQLFEHILIELAPVCLAEQEFCVQFFHLNDDPPSDISTTPKKGKKSSQKEINLEIRTMMPELFPSLETELNSFIVYGITLDSFNCLYVYLRLNQHVRSAEDTGSFLSKTYGSCLIKVKRSFDGFVERQVQMIRDTRPNKTKKVNILPFVSHFEDFAQQAEAIFRGSEHRVALDKAYVQMVNTVFEEIGRVASESQKTPSTVIMMENHHHMFSVLSQLKISSLENQKKEAKIRYQDQRQGYVISCLGTPMEKLHMFFEGIESKVACGVKMAEVGYQLAFSKQELRKVIKEYPSKEVKKGLELLYKKVDKQMCSQENLLQVVWHSMQDEFLKQYTHFEDMIKKCYPDSGITLEFGISDLLAFFSEIAQSH